MSTGKKFRILWVGLLILNIFSLVAYADGMRDDGSGSETGKKSKKSNSLSSDELLKFQYCGKDSDCVESINGCCQCLQGDKKIGIAKDRLGDFRSQFHCDNISCPQEDDSSKCEDGIVSCLNHRCTYFGVEKE